MTPLLERCQDVLSKLDKFKTVDEDWGQLQEFGQQPPVAFPCVLIDMADADFSNIGKQRGAAPEHRQQGTASIKFTFAALKLTSTAKSAPQRQKQKAWELHDLIESAHEVLQGFSPVEYCSGLVRTKWRRTRRSDGIQQFEVTYSVGMSNV